LIQFLDEVVQRLLVVLEIRNQTLHFRHFGIADLYLPVVTLNFFLQCAFTVPISIMFREELIISLLAMVRVVIGK